MAVVGLMLMLSTITDRMHLERPTEYALTFDRRGLRRRKENDVETRESTSPTTIDTITINSFYIISLIYVNLY